MMHGEQNINNYISFLSLIDCALCSVSKLPDCRILSQMQSPKFKVIIAGGSVAGLSLAKMLETVGIDFVVLESYTTIAPQVGASIGLLGSGLRILDQLGVFEDLSQRAPDVLRSTTLRSLDGILARHSGLDRLFLDRYAGTSYHS
jgi:hypothetical protein